VREALVARHAETCSALDVMIKAAVHGEPLSGEAIASVVTDYLIDLSSDVDSVLEMVRNGGHYSELAEHCLQMSILGMAVGIEMGMAENRYPPHRLLRTGPRLGEWHASILSFAMPARAQPCRVLEVQKHPIYTLEILRTLSGIPTSSL